MRIAFIGDLAFNYRYEEMSESPFSAIESELSESDFVVGNLECFARGKGENKKKFPRLSTSADTIQRMLQYTHCGLVTLANNHCYDNLDDGFFSTCEVLDKLKIKHIGAGKENVAIPCFITGNDGINICFLNYITENTNPKRPNDSTIKQCVYDREKVLEDIRKYKNNVDHVVLLFHWGGDNEGYMYPSPTQLLDAKSFIDAGASLIVGGHSHTLQPYEIYNGKCIYYSLGNFCFDDTHCEGKVNIRQPKEKESMILKVTFTKNNYTCEHVFIHNENLHLKYSDKVGKNWNRRNIIFKYIFFSQFTYLCYFFWSRYILKIKKYAFSPSLLRQRLYKKFR